MLYVIHLTTGRAIVANKKGLAFVNAIVRSRAVVTSDPRIDHARKQQIQDRGQQLRLGAHHARASLAPARSSTSDHLAGLFHRTQRRPCHECRQP
jgi:hypothetical protein